MYTKNTLGKSFFLFFILLIAGFSIQTKVFASEKTIYVKASTGYTSSSSSTCGSQENNACKTLKSAIDQVKNDNNTYKIILLSDLQYSEYMGPIENKKVVVTSKSGSVYKITMPSSCDDFIFHLKNSSLTLKNVILDGGSRERTNSLIYAHDNSNITIEDGAVLQNNYRKDPGSAINMLDGTITMTGGEIKNNKAGLSGGIAGTNVKLTLSGNAKINNNESTNGGGAIYIDGKESKINISGDVQISSNKAKNSGGAIFFKEGTFTMTGGTINNNTSDGDGGGLALEDSTVTLSGNVIISNNKSGKNGGGIFTLSSKVTIDDNVEITSNSTESGTGGGIYALSGTLTLNNCLFFNNKAVFGGGVGVASTTLVINGSDTNIYKNKASYSGGGISASESEVTINDVKVSNNIASCGGGIALFENTTFEMNGGVISNNTASKDGGGIYANAKKEETTIMTIKAGKIIDNDVKGINEDGVYIGGGISVGEYCTLNLTNVVIKDNYTTDSRYEFAAGGIGLCPTGSLFLYALNGGAIYHNQKNGHLVDILFNHYISDHDLFVSYLAFTNAVHHWTDFYGKPVVGGKFDLTDKKDGFITLVSHLSDEEIKNAEENAKVIISGNVSNGYNGAGGIMCNGVLNIGEKSEADDNGGLEVTKVVKGEEIDNNKEFTFNVVLEDKTINGTYGDMVFVNGVATFTLKNHESKIAIGLPGGIKYTVTELKYDGYSVVKTGDTGNIVPGGLLNTKFTNTLEPIIDIPKTPDEPTIDNPPTSDPLIFGAIIGVIIFAISLICAYRKFNFLR